ncbi:DUF3833 domain-containing protein [Laribacter hongkongensis]|uniref:DUF3833 domain-containing protein n=1 Tax=Laribacter hongkongensis TaxID=168471 RepID=UPI001EFD22B3|nr:DUF3833 domain-containing protein [Laribacter hongkongensis]MCG8997243.1 DUF3833 domain-containing protein [Laribacter hongkongensis]MCG9003298.1 DUF3833 domain-containing protein [Laribacter hongkongensis]MCG9012672.1 DUF3833 domain-containing protein [Laribacter hongkongensis]MCG9018815.1 DUF3833 domain-containing protein [Laribacter hongkongensis]MCG9027565.1 DUF3833 domain-containing protein [Laribacter hongkongensis]
MKRLTALLVALLTGCSTPSVQDYRDNTPKLDLYRFFGGHTQAWGMFRDRNGLLVKRFTVDITGRREGDALLLDERFVYADGTRQQRTWRLEPKGNGKWRGTAADVIGEAEGEVSGNALHWRYVLRLPVGDREWAVDFDDWMFLVDEHTMLNSARMSKYGFGLGEVSLFFRKQA